MFLKYVEFVFDFKNLDFVSLKFVDVLCKFGLFELNCVVFLFLSLCVFVFLVLKLVMLVGMLVLFLKDFILFFMFFDYKLFLDFKLII